MSGVRPRRQVENVQTILDRTRTTLQDASVVITFSLQAIQQEHHTHMSDYVQTSRDAASTVMQRLQSDPEFAAKFSEDPADAAREAGMPAKAIPAFLVYLHDKSATTSEVQGYGYDDNGDWFDDTSAFDPNAFNFDPSSLISQDGGTLVSQGGGNLVSQGGGNLVSQGGGN